MYYVYFTAHYGNDTYSNAIADYELDGENHMRLVLNNKKTTVASLLSVTSTAKIAFSPLRLTTFTTQLYNTHTQVVGSD